MMNANENKSDMQYTGETSIRIQGVDNERIRDGVGEVLNHI